MRHPKHKTEICKTFMNHGTCPYGVRCRFVHFHSLIHKSEHSAISPQAKLLQMDEAGFSGDEAFSEEPGWFQDQFD